MRYLSVCSGIEAASVAWHHLGWTPVGFSEIEPFPAAVLAHRFPNVPNYGDMTKFEEWPIERGTVDLLVGGTPCQSYSVAGLRQGLADPRGSLMLTYLAIAARLRPRWIVWENVPGVLSSNGGRDFGAFLGALGELGYGFAYRVLDAQYVRVGGWPRAVPQRRRRVFVVGCLGDGAAAAEVLALEEGLQRHLEASGKTRKGVAADAEGGSRGGCWWDGSDCAGTLTKAYRWQNDRDGLQQDDAVAALRASAGSSGFHEMNHPVIAQPVAFTPGNLARGAGASPNAEVFPTLKCSEGRGADDQRPCVAFQQNQLGEVRCNTVAGTVNTNSNASGRNTPMVAIGGTAQSVAFPIDTQNMTEGHSSGGLGFGQSGDPSFTVTKGHSHAVAHAAVAFDWQSGGDSRGLDPKDTAQLQRCQTPAVAFTRCDNGQDAAVDHTPTMRCGSNYSAHLAVAHTMTVRRLTPVECERLQGFPDNWTAIPWRKKTAEECPDGPRYKALGNSMACNCMAWIGERIAAYEQRGRVDPTPAGTAGIAPAGELNHEGDRHG